MTFVEHVHCSRCGRRCSGVDPDMGLVVRAWVECPECLDDESAEVDVTIAGAEFVYRRLSVLLSEWGTLHGFPAPAVQQVIGRMRAVLGLPTMPRES